MYNNQKVLAEFEKNSLEIVRISSVDYQGNHYIDLRLWIVGDKDGHREEIPTRKGLCMHSELLPDLIQALQQAQDLFKKSLVKNSNKRNEKSKEKELF